MGCDFNVYFGPYVKYTVELAVSQQDNCLDNWLCLNEGDSVFCPTCGIANKVRFVTKETELADDDWKYGWKKSHGGLSDFLCGINNWGPPESYIKDGKKYRDYILISNKKDFGIDCTSGTPVEHAIEEGEVEFEYAKFEDFFKEEIDKLKSTYQNVNIFYGIVTYYS